MEIPKTYTNDEILKAMEKISQVCQTVQEDYACPQCPFYHVGDCAFLKLEPRHMKLVYGYGTNLSVVDKNEQR